MATLPRNTTREYIERESGQNFQESGFLSGDKLLTYYDIANEGYRTAKGKYTLIAVGGNNAQ